MLETCQALDYISHSGCKNGSSLARRNANFAEDDVRQVENGRWALKV